MMGEWIIEPATVESLPDILHIEEACFSAPWTRKMLEAELSGNPFAHFLLAKLVPPSDVGSISIVGYLCFWVVFEEVRLMNLAVIESMRHKGIARALVMQALEVGLAQAARAAAAHRIVTSLISSNLGVAVRPQIGPGSRQGKSHQTSPIRFI